MDAVTDFARVVKLQEFLARFPLMTLAPSQAQDLILEGNLEFVAHTKSHGEVADTYQVRIRVSKRFPSEIPVVHEIARRIPRDGNYHTNADGSFCMGSRIRLLILISREPTLLGFISNCLIPYLYAVSVKLAGGGSFILGELAHGATGELEDYRALFGVDSRDQVRLTVKYLGMKKRRANKLPCPCGCGTRLGKCKYNRKVAEMRRLTDRKWYQSLVQEWESFV
jgi:hypothetical protein